MNKKREKELVENEKLPNMVRDWMERMKYLRNKTVNSVKDRF